jgi:hypothetical protein
MKANMHYFNYIPLSFKGFDISNSVSTDILREANISLSWTFDILEIWFSVEDVSTSVSST